MTNEELTERIQHGDSGLITDLWEQMRGFVWKCAEGFKAGDLTEDLMQEGFLGMLRAVMSFDRSTGCKFTTYAGYYIRNEMRRFLYMARPGIRLPEHMAISAREYERFVSDFAKLYGREPTDTEIRQGLGLMRSVNVQTIKAAAMDPASLNSPINERGTELGDLQAASDDPAETVIDEVFRQQLGRDVRAAIDALPGALREMVLLKYYNGMTDKQAASTQGITTGEARNRLNRAYRALKTRPKLKQYREELYGRAMRGSLSAFLTTWTSSTEQEAFKLFEISGGPDSDRA